MRLKLDSQPGSALILFAAIWAALVAPAASEERKREPLVISAHTMKSIINWESWSPEANEPMIIRADSDDALIFFRFKRPPKNLKSLKVSSNAAVYVQTKSGLVPLTKKARANPNPPAPPLTPN